MPLILSKYFMSFSKQKQLGQVFLKDQAVIKKIIQAGEISKKDQILEIGPGKGILTQALIKTGAGVIAIEKDSQLVKFLKNRFKNKSNLKIIQADIQDFLQDIHLHQDFSGQAEYRILNTEYKIIGNIPYYLTSHLLRLLLENPIKPALIVLMIQKEVAQRIISQPPRMNLLATSVQFYAHSEIICYVPKNAFSPIPQVDSAIIKITPVKTNKNTNKTLRIKFFKIIKAGFKQPRKLLVNNLNANLKIDKEILQKALKQLKIPLQARAQDLSSNEWISLSLLITKDNV